jgi:hypothetical protein
MTYRHTPILLLLFMAACKPARSPDEIARDRDGDGIANAADGCPDKPESANEHNDHDGSTDRLRANRGLLVPGIVVLALSVPLTVLGAQMTASGLAPKDEIDPFMTMGLEYVGVPLLAAAAVHQAVGIPLIIAGAMDRYWTDGANDDGPPATAPVRFELGKRGVGIRY